MSAARLAAVTAAVVAASAPAAQACESAANGMPSGRQAAGTGARPPFVIGDSTTILAAPGLGRRGIEADARGCRQFDDGVRTIARRRARGRLGEVAVLALGANGPVSRAQIARARSAIGAGRFLGLVTPRNLASTAAAMRAAARSHPDRVLLLDWAAASAGHPGWFSGDGLHPTPAGAGVFARFVGRGLAPFLRRVTLPASVDAKGVVACGAVRARGRRTRVFVTRGGAMGPAPAEPAPPPQPAPTPPAEAAVSAASPGFTCARARRLARAPRLRPPVRWRWTDVRGRVLGPWTDAWRRWDGAVTVAGVTSR